MTQEELEEAYELDDEAGLQRLLSLGMPHDAAVLLKGWHEETSLLEEYERLMALSEGALAELRRRWEESRT